MFADWFLAWMGIRWQQLPSQAKKSSPRHSETGKCWLWMSVKVPSRVPNQTATLLQWQEKPHTHKLQVVIDQPSQEMICTAYTHGRKHDFQVFPHSQAPPNPPLHCSPNRASKDFLNNIPIVTHPENKCPGRSLSPTERHYHRELAPLPVVCEDVIGCLIIFKSFLKATATAAEVLAGAAISLLGCTTSNFPSLLANLCKRSNKALSFPSFLKQLSYPLANWEKLPKSFL